MPRSRGRDSRKNHRLRREIGIGRKTVHAMTAQWQKTFVVLLTVLAQSGGEVTITKGTMDQITTGLDKLTWALEPGKVAGEFVVRVVEGKAGPEIATVPETPTVTPDEVPNAAV